MEPDELGIVTTATVVDVFFLCNKPVAELWDFFTSDRDDFFGESGKLDGLDTLVLSAVAAVGFDDVVAAVRFSEAEDFSPLDTSEVDGGWDFVSAAAMVDGATTEAFARLGWRTWISSVWASSESPTSEMTTLMGLTGTMAVSRLLVEEAEEGDVELSVVVMLAYKQSGAASLGLELIDAGPEPLVWLEVGCESDDSTTACFTPPEKEWNKILYL